MDFCDVCGGDNSTCTDCEGNIKRGFVNNGSCSTDCEGDTETCGEFLIGIICFVQIMILLRHKNFVK